MESKNKLIKTYNINLATYPLNACCVHCSAFSSVAVLETILNAYIIYHTAFQPEMTVLSITIFLV
jgi:hypothetical protein